MTTAEYEAELLHALDKGDEMLRCFVRGEMAYDEFERRYDSFYLRWPLDGHEADQDEREVLSRHEPRIAVHRAVWTDVMCLVTDDALMNSSGARKAGHFGVDEARGKVKSILTGAQSVRPDS